MLDKYIVKNGRKLRYGYTTGSCAAAAARGALEKLLFDGDPHSVEIETPKGWSLEIETRGIVMKENYAECYVIKDGGDDPDCTNEIRIYARVRKNDKKEIVVTGGEGIGVATRKGLAVEAGAFAINPVPLEMIKREVEKIRPPDTGITIEISAPQGREISKKTFNARLGIEGGISILGTTGIVEPMSHEAVRESLALEISIIKERGHDSLVFVPGNYGRDFALNSLSIPEDLVVRTSNYIGYMLEQAGFYKIENILIVGHIGKLIKVAGGIFNTHSSVSDARLEILAANYLCVSDDIEVPRKIMESKSTEEALDYIDDKSLYRVVADKIAEKCSQYTENSPDTEAVIFSLRRGLLGKSENADRLIEKLREAE